MAAMENTSLRYLLLISFHECSNSRITETNLLLCVIIMLHRKYDINR